MSFRPAPVYGVRYDFRLRFYQFRFTVLVAPRREG